MKNQVARLLAVVAVLLLLQSCGASKQNHDSRLLLKEVDSSFHLNFQVPEPVIKAGDLLTILVYSDNKEATEIYNQPQTGGSASAAGANMSQISTLGRGYLVDGEGNVLLHTVGTVKAAGLTRPMLVAKLNEAFKPYLKNPYAVVRFANARVTVMGEVTRPGTIELPDARVSIFDAIGFAGDFTNFARRDNILVVREENGQRIAHRLDLRNSSIYTSDFYYLRSNDLVYVEPTRRKPTGNEQVLMRNVTIGSTIVSVLVLVITLIRR